MNHHSTLSSRVLFSAATILGATGLAAAELPPKPVTKIPSKTQLSIPWLKSITFSPPVAVAGATITGVVMLRRPAHRQLTIGIRSAAGIPEEGGTIQYVDGLGILPSSLTFNQGSERESFTINSSRPPSTQANSPRNFNIEAVLGQEKISSTVTVTYIPTTLP